MWCDASGLFHCRKNENHEEKRTKKYGSRKSVGKNGEKSIIGGLPVKPFLKKLVWWSKEKKDPIFITI